MLKKLFDKALSKSGVNKSSELVIGFEPENYKGLRTQEAYDKTEALYHEFKKADERVQAIYRRFVDEGDAYMHKRTIEKTKTRCDGALSDNGMDQMRKSA